ncbi:MAG: hypothetical protein LBV33_00335 [Lachnospiraceae bacterium]|jgi:uncharacterized protein with FMN-binding domain|nr:hypothetical protein [Lachnospiraceae bacterium]
MKSKTKIIVLHLKELIYTGVFAVLGILFIVLLVMMFLPDKKTDAGSGAAPTVTYVPGIYTTSLLLNDNVLDIQVTVDAYHINDVSIVNLDEAVATMFPLIEPAFETLSLQIVDQQSTDNITYSDENKYTSMVLLDAINASLDKAIVPSEDELISTE